MYAEFIDSIFSLVRESLFIENMKQKVKVKKRLTISTLFNRAKVLDDGQTGNNVFQGFRPMAPSSTLSKAARAKKLLQKREMMIKEKKEMALAAGIDWKSDESDDENPQDIKVPPIPNLLQDEELHLLIIDLCKALRSAERYWEALEIINLTLRLATNKLSSHIKEELRTLGAQVAYNITDPKQGFDCVKYIVQQHPHSISAWNCYYKVKMKLGNTYFKHSKFLHRMRIKLKDNVAPMVITGHQFTMLNQHQIAAKEYLEAYKLMPDNPLINLCVGSALINLTLGFRLQNKHQCVTQGLAFLYQNLLLCKNSQEALYNIARAYHHVGLVSLAGSYYEKVLATHEKDYPIPKLPNESLDSAENRRPGYCDLRREAAHNLHLIYKKSGAFDLARQVLRDHCSF
uniref:General transcription factor 3C polypeptide 3 n=1 Tax=Kalanchoe fedtschenkoi TaxID=63787 RepID=A0A7N0TII1_KALFE